MSNHKKKLKAKLNKITGRIDDVKRGHDVFDVANDVVSMLEELEEHLDGLEEEDEEEEDLDLDDEDQDEDEDDDDDDDTDDEADDDFGGGGFGGGGSSGDW